MTEIQAPLPPIKRIGPLHTARDAKVLQAKLLRMYTKGDVDETFFKTATYGINNLLNCIKTEHLISPATQPGFEPVKIIHISTPATQLAIDTMNADILEPPE